MQTTRWPMAMLVGVAIVFPTWSAMAEDWPAWRYDARRSAASNENLPDRLYPQWSLRLPAPMPAWPNEPRLQFDLAYEPVVFGQTLLLGSSVDGSVVALDTATGRQQWKFFTEGPVRFAPSAWNNKAYVGSDDGHVYCLDVRDGRMLWKFRGAPDDRPERRQLGNNRLISFWPVRGAPVLAGGTLYFAAGIWPTMGVFVAALDAESGKLVWRNDRLGSIDRVRIDHNNLVQSGLSPQGYLVVQGDLLLVPNGRSMPAGLDRKTGELIYYLQGYRNGDCHVAASEQVALVGQSGVIDLRTGREVGSRWATAGKLAPRGFDVGKVQWFESPVHSYKKFPGCSWQSALFEGRAYGLERGTFYAHDLRQTRLSEYEQKTETSVIRPWRWDAAPLWQLAVDGTPKKTACSPVIRAGKRLYAQVGEKLVGIDVPDRDTGQPKLAWSTPLKTPVLGLAAAGGRLFASGSDGSLTCFGSQETSRPTPVAPPSPTSREENDALRWDRMAGEIVAHSKVADGYCVVLGVGGRAFVQELLRQSQFKVLAVYPEQEKVNALREVFVADGSYPGRVEVFAGDPSRFPLPPYLASLLIAEDTPASADPDEPLAVRLFEVLRPYGGTACLVAGESSQAAWEKAGAAGKLEGAQLRRAGGFLLASRVGPLSGSAPWMHESADAARSFFSKDQRVKPPLGILWYGDGPGYGFWKHKDYGGGVKPQAAGGRVIALQQHTNTLYAYDVYTGRQLWTERVDLRARHALTDQGVYVAGAGRVQVLDPATGHEVAEFPFTAGASPVYAASDIRVTDDLIVVALSAAKEPTGIAGDVPLVALDRASGKTLWRRANRGLTSNSLALGGGLVFCTDTAAPAPTGIAAQADKQPEVLPCTVLALDARTGQTRWIAKKEIPFRRTSKILAWLAYSESCGLLLFGDYGRTCAFEVASGRQVWEAATPSFRQPWILRGETLIEQNGGQLDIRTGERIRGPQLPIGHFGCNYAVGCENLVLVRDASACYVEIGSRKKQHFYAARSGCSNSLIAADGLLSVPCFSVGCVCNYPLQTSFAMVHMPEAGKWIDAMPIPQAFDPRPAEPAKTAPARSHENRAKP